MIFWKGPSNDDIIHEQHLSSKPWTIYLFILCIGIVSLVSTLSALKFSVLYWNSCFVVVYYLSYLYKEKKSFNPLPCWQGASQITTHPPRYFPIILATFLFSCPTTQLVSVKYPHPWWLSCWDAERRILILIIQTSTIQNSTIQNSTIQNSTIQNITIQNSTIQNSTIQNRTIKSSTIQTSTIQNRTIQNRTIKTSTIQTSIIHISTIHTSTKPKTDQYKTNQHNTDYHNTDQHKINCHNTD